MIVEIGNLTFAVECIYLIAYNLDSSFSIVRPFPYLDATLNVFIEKGNKTTFVAIFLNLTCLYINRVFKFFLCWDSFQLLKVFKTRVNYIFCISYYLIDILRRDILSIVKGILLASLCFGIPSIDCARALPLKKQRTNLHLKILHF